MIKDRIITLRECCNHRPEREKRELVERFGLVKGSMGDTESILIKVLLSFQLCLGFWQIVKLTGFAAIIKAIMSWCMSMLPWGLGTLSSSYYQLKKFDDGPCFGKYGQCLVTSEGDQPMVISEASHEKEIRIEYLGKEILLERKEGNKLFVDREMAYYITDPIWHSLLCLKIVCRKTVFLKGHKVLFTGLIAGGVMDKSEVLDCLILRNRIIKSLSYGGLSLFLPINLSISEEKLLKGLNLVGLFLQAKKRVYSLIPTLLSFTSAVLEFSTPLRVWIYSIVNHIFCWAIHALTDFFPLKTRIWIYSLLEWIENTKPSNDIEWRVVRGVEPAIIGGGAKACVQNASLVQPRSGLETSYEKVFDLWKVSVTFDEDRKKGCTNRFLSDRQREYFEVDCSRDEYKNLMIFIDCLVTNRIGSLESYDPKYRVCRVRSFKESVICYAKNGFPQVYKLELENVVVK
ncbi:hypothetical protein SUGI_0669150 [Cryptomeria japonica]|nr:hypothetical protein SUGI_0669150 [Cryptomeria japonica]